MKVTLHLNGSAAAIGAFLATVPASLLGSESDTTVAPTPSVAHVAIPMPSPTDEDDDTGPVNTAAPATDANGLPWDARIHAKTKGQNEDKTWRKKRNVDAALVAAVEAELRGAAAPAPVPAPVPMPMPVPMAAPMPAPMTVPAPLPVPAVAAPAPLPMPDPVPAPVTAPEPVPTPAPAAADIDFTGFMAHLTTKTQTGAVTSDDLVALVQQINAAYAPHGHQPLGAITDLASDVQKLHYAVQCLQHTGKW